MIYSWVDYQRLDWAPQWADALGWLITMSVVACIFVTMIVRICQEEGSFGEVLFYKCYMQSFNVISLEVEKIMF